MKKLFILFAIAFALIACNKETELGPEYKIPAEISDVVYPEVVYASQEVSVTANFTSEYGLYSGFIHYWIGDDMDTVKDIAVQSYGSAQFQASYSGKIPAQVAGTKVSFQVACWTPYYVLAATKVYTYTVLEPVTPQE